MSKKYDTTGIPELDDVLGGGYKVGSLVVVRGATGLGKTTLLVKGALAQEYLGRFYDMTPRGRTQPIVDFANELGRRRFRKADYHDIKYLLGHTTSNKARSSRALVLLRKDHEREVKNVNNLVHDFAGYHFSMGGNLFVIDGIVESNKSDSYEAQIKDVAEIQIRLQNIPRWERGDGYNPSEVTLIISETSDKTYVEELFGTYAKDSPFADIADTVLLLGWGEIEGQRHPVRVLQVAKHRWSSAAPSEFLFKKDGNKLSLERIV